MSDIHIDDFFRDAGRILLQLYLHFPRPYTLYVMDISGEDTPDEYGLHSDRHLACFSTMIWLADSGYLRFVDTINHEAIDQAVLTQKGFTLLAGRCTLPDTPPADAIDGLPPIVATEHASNVFQLREAVRSDSSTAIRRVVQHLLNESKPG